MRIIVTGASGFLGKHTADCLRKAGHEVVAVVHRDARPGEVAIDLGDPSLYARLSMLDRADVVVHLAAQIGFGATEPGHFYRMNVLSTALMAELARAQGTRFIFASTAIVCGSIQSQIGPDTPVRPDTSYAQSKFAAEQCIESSGAVNTIIRFAGLYGLSGPSSLFLNRSIDEAFGGTPPRVTGKGAALRTYLYVRDAASIIRTCIENDIRGIRYASGGDARSLRSMLDILCEEILDGRSPIEVDGKESSDQLVDRDPVFGRGMTFKEAVRDMALVRSRGQGQCA